MVGERGGLMGVWDINGAFGGEEFSGEKSSGLRIKKLKNKS